MYLRIPLVYFLKIFQYILLKFENIAVFDIDQ